MNWSHSSERCATVSSVVVTSPECVTTYVPRSEDTTFCHGQLQLKYYPLRVLKQKVCTGNKLFESGISDEPAGDDSNLWVRFTGNNILGVKVKDEDLVCARDDTSFHLDAGGELRKLEVVETLGTY
jgi:hypothetical protein